MTLTRFPIFLVGFYRLVLCSFQVDGLGRAVFGIDMEMLSGIVLRFPPVEPPIHAFSLKYPPVLLRSPIRRLRRALNEFDVNLFDQDCSILIVARFRPKD